ncbi:DUF3592 domain-containing protein [Streptomyces sp. NPDC001601]|uniref:DUF3592 domain-containing protein n=1 Tax=Streptomyces sp. NPDC001601 TaxID=3364592 RepID=UPI00368CACD2
MRRGLSFAEPLPASHSTGSRRARGRRRSLGGGAGRARQAARDPAIRDLGFSHGGLHGGGADQRGNHRRRRCNEARCPASSWSSPAWDPDDRHSVGIRETTDGDGCAQLYPRVRYTLPDGREVTGEGGAHSVRTPLPEGDRAELLYRPDDPERIILIACSAIASLLRSACIT